MPTVKRTRISNELLLQAWADSHPDPGSRWRLVNDHTDDWILTNLSPTGVDKVFLGADLAKELAKVCQVCPHPRRGTAYQPQQFMTLLRRAARRAERNRYSAGQVVQHAGREYTVTRVHSDPRGDRTVLASEDGVRFYAGSSCSCGGTPHRTVRGVDMVTENEYEVCTFCRGVVR